VALVRGHTVVIRIGSLKYFFLKNIYAFVSIVEAEQQRFCQWILWIDVYSLKKAVLLMSKLKKKTFALNLQRWFYKFGAKIFFCYCLLEAILLVMASLIWDVSLHMGSIAY
jgi:hypothetical protein